jgi:hypothetical protein
MEEERHKKPATSTCSLWCAMDYRTVQGGERKTYNFLTFDTVRKSEQRRRK